MRKARSRPEIYIPFFDDETEDLSFTKNDVREVVKAWNAGECYVCIAQRIKRDVDIVFVLLIDLARTGWLEQRTHGYYGYCLKACDIEKGNGKWKIG